MGASSQAGVFGGLNPTEYNASNPLTLFIIQVVIILVICRLLHYPLSLLRQPRVIAEVIGGVLLGPSVMGHIPNFNSTIFPTASMPLLTLVANIGLVFFLFLVGLELDIGLAVKNLRTAGTVAIAGMALPFALGVAVSYGLYRTYHLADSGSNPVSFGLYALFIGVAMAITAFPVLARILTELKLLSTNVGTVVLSAGVTNDIVGWILLALTVALVNASSGIVALWVILCSCGWILFLGFIVRPIFRYAARRSGSLDTGPTQLIMVFTFLVVLVSAFFTSMIGVHPIFGGFLAGMVVPHERVFAVGVTEKIEDIITLLFLPLYFALSGLSTNLGLLDNGITWGYTIAIIVIAMFSKVTAGTLAARVNGLLWRESFTVGMLMSCKGLVELIVLNVGLQAGLLSQRVFTMFVVMALVCTFLTTPLTTLLYPAWYQTKTMLWRRGEINWDGTAVDMPPLPSHRGEVGRPSAETVREGVVPLAPFKVLVTLTRIEAIPGITTFLRVLIPSNISSDHAQALHPSRRLVSEKADSVSTAHRSDALMIHGLKLEELTDRTSALMRATRIEDEDSPLSLRNDPILQSFVSVGRFWDRCRITGAKAIIPDNEFAQYTASTAVDLGSDMVVVPWTMASGADGDFIMSRMVRIVKGLYESAPCDVVVILDRGFDSAAIEHVNKGHNAANWMFAGGGLEGKHHILFPYFGTKDDLEAFKFLKERVFANTDVTATILHQPDFDTDSHDSLLSFTSAYPDRIVIESIESNVTDVSGYILEKAKQEIQSPADFIMLGRETAGATGSWTRMTSPSSSSVVTESTQSNVLGELADRLTSGGVLGSIIVYRAK
ncbi:Sodium/hydrogen exchanger family-domain-containing protein [Lipomyces kononenkoae]